MQQEATPPICEVIILTARSFEYQAVLHYLEEPQEAVHPSGTIYYHGRIHSEHQTWRVAVAEIALGGPSAALETERAIQYFGASIALFVGTASGLSDVRLGDVIAATKIHGYEYGKDGATFEPRPEQWKASYPLLQRAQAEARTDVWLARLDDPGPDAAPRVFVGPLAAGEKVVVSQQSDVARRLRAIYGDTLAVESEGHGFLQAVHANHSVHGLVIRGIGSLIDDKAEAEATGWSDVAARHAAAFAFQVLLKFTLPGSAILPSMSNIPYARNLLFQSRPGEFEYLENLLFGPRTAHRLTCVGLVGMGGIGKTHLAVELAYRCQKQQRFPGGIFWITATETDIFAWQHHFAELAATIGYIPSDDDNSRPQESEARRARYLCHYLAKHADSLLLLDNVQVPDLVTDIFFKLIGTEAQCMILYTSRLTTAPEAITVYDVKDLPEDVALRLLLKGARPDLLCQIESGKQHDEIDAARNVCQRVGYLPLALFHLRNLLKRDRHVPLKRLYEVLNQQGIDTLRDVLFKTLDLSWQGVQNEEERHLFLLAALCPEAMSIPVWLIGLAAGLGEEREIFGRLGRALFHLQEVSLIEELSENQIQLHPLVREFGQDLINQDTEYSQVLRKEAGEGLIAAFTHLEKLEGFVRESNYWDCLERVRLAGDYLELVEQGERKGELSLVQRLRFVHQWLEREAHLLGNEQWWPEKLSGFFYQQLFNQSVEEKVNILTGTTSHLWIRQCESTGITSPVLLKHFPVGNFPKIAYSPDGCKLLSAWWSKGTTTIYLWHAQTGQLLFRDSLSSARHPTLAFSLDSQMFFVCNGGVSLRVWDIASFSCSKFLLESPQYAKEQLWKLEDSLAAMAISPDGKYVAIVRDSSILIWSLAEKEFLFTLDAPRDKARMNKIVFSPQGEKMGASSEEGSSVWDVQTRKLIWSQSDMNTVGIAFSHDNHLVLIGTAEKGIWCYDIHTGNLSQICALSTTSYKCITFSHDMRKVAASANSGLGKVELWNVQTKQCFCSVFHNDVVVDMAFSPDGKTLFTGGEDKAVRLWNVQEDTEQKTYHYWGRGIFDTYFSPQKMLLARENGIVEIRDIRTGNQLLRLTSPDKNITLIALSPDEATLITGLGHAMVDIWDARTGSLLFSVPIGQGTLSIVAFAPDNRHVVLSCSDGIVRLLDIRTKRLKILRKYKRRIHDIMFSSDGMYLFIYTSDDCSDFLQCYVIEKFFGFFSLWSLWEHEWYGHPGIIGLHKRMILSPDNKRILTMSARTCLWHASWGIPIARDLYDASCAAFSFDGNVLAVGHDNGMVNFWDSRTGEFISSLEEYSYRLHRESLNAVSFSPDGCFFIGCDADGYILFWCIDDRRSQRGKLVGAYMMKEYPKKAYVRGEIKIYWQSNTHLTVIDKDELCIGIYQLDFNM